MFWGATEAVRPGGREARPATRRFAIVASLILLALSGTVAMASASTPSAPARAAAYSEPSTNVQLLKQLRPQVPPTSVAPVSPPTTVRRAPAPTTHKAAPLSEHQAVAEALRTRSTTPAAASLAGADTCSAALAYLAAHSAPGFTFECPGYALGHQAMTCIDVSGVCPGSKLIVISVVCPASYMNEAHNSWVLSGLSSGSIDPYGYCH